MFVRIRVTSKGGGGEKKYGFLLGCLNQQWIESQTAEAFVRMLKVYNHHGCNHTLYIRYDAIKATDIMIGIVVPKTYLIN